MSLRKILAQEGLIASRPGSHWDPYPRSQVGRTVDSLIKVLDDYLRDDGKLFYMLYRDASEKDYILLGQLRGALVKRDQASSKRYFDALLKSHSSASSIAQDNLLITYVLDGRENI